MSLLGYLFGNNSNGEKEAQINIDKLRIKIFKGIDILNYSNKNEIILKLATQIQDESNHHLNTLCKELFNIDPKKHYFQLKQEVIAKGILVTGKRRYAMYITNKEGVAVEELDMKGLELMKSNMNKLFKS